MNQARHLAAALFLVFSLSVSASAITWFPKDFSCPIDNQKNTFLVVGSYGSYIYQYPSKYQWLFFPVTDSPTFYLCKKCSLATFMWDFDELPKDKLDAIRTVLKDVKAPKAFNEYTEVPVLDRLAVMEKVYTVLDKDDDWWERFHRIKGYHLGKAGKTEEAKESRKRSLVLIEQFINDEKNETSKKLLHYIAGAMNHFIGDDKAAVAHFEKGLATKFAEKGATEEELKNGELGLNERIGDFMLRMKTSGDEPRNLDNEPHDH